MAEEMRSAAGVDSARDGKSPILVTGLPRSGTSWLGEMLALGGDVIHVQEPLSVLNRQTLFKSRVSRWFTYITDENESLYLPYYRDAMAFRPHPLDDIRRARIGSPHDPFRIAARWGSFALGRVQKRRLLLRDPFAVVSLDWFRRRLDSRIVVTVRHPLAVVSSLKRLDLAFDFRNLLEQPALMRDHLEPYRPEMEELVGSADVVAQGCLLWRIVYGHVAFERERDRSIHLVRHEDLSANPLDEYERLYHLLDLSFTEKAKRTVARFTSARRRTEVSARRPFDVRPLDSHANLGNWRHRLSDEDVERIVAATRDAARAFYPEDAPSPLHTPAVRARGTRG
jgi:hypothetical protein